MFFDTNIGLNNIWAWALFTFSTYKAYSSILIKRWIIPRPPFLAISLAILNSVTVSIGEDTIGTFKGTLREKRDFKSHWERLDMSLY